MTGDKLYVLLRRGQPTIRICNLHSDVEMIELVLQASLCLVPTEVPPVKGYRTHRPVQEKIVAKIGPHERNSAEDQQGTNKTKGQ